MRHLDYAPDEHGRQVEQTITLAILRAKDGARFPYARLQEWLEGIERQDLSEALSRLVRRGVVQIKRSAVEATKSYDQRVKVELLAAVVLHVLVTSHQALAVADVAKKCERDYTRPHQREEVELALRWIAEDELAIKEGDGWLATRAAIRAAELSF